MILSCLGFDELGMRGSAATSLYGTMMRPGAPFAPFCV